ncbi:MAG: NAD-dependent epimerase/dehydratase family protein [Betaproteobacteria bacterium]|nr:MAG: NAD-dependent epimerase/dehydratase family protein [Betaproteobacteria bacterium]
MKRLLIAGFGDIARRAAPRLERGFEVARLSRAYGCDLDRPDTLNIEGAQALLHCAPPPDAGETDTRTANLLAALEKARILPARVVYVSTSGVYGDCHGERVDESRPLAPQTGRARRRVDAERRLTEWCGSHGAALTVLRAPGIYAADRLPLERLRAGTPVLRAEDDVYTNHIHADDLARIVARALEDDAPAGIFNSNDDSGLKMGEWFDLVADTYGLPRPPRIARAQAAGRIPPGLLSFMSESRRLDNRRLKQVFGARLRYPTVYEGLRHEHALGADQSA